jgi:hypothetical protein
MYYYSVYGLTIASDVPFEIPLFTASEPQPTSVDLTLIASAEPLWNQCEWDNAQFVSYAIYFGLELRISGQRYCFSLRDTASQTEVVQWVIDGNLLYCHVTQPLSYSAYLESLLLEIILPKYLQLNGRSLFHAAVVEIEGRATLLSAPTGTGKSTLSLRLSQLGARFMSDDLAVMREVDGQFMIEAAYPKSRLREDSVTALGVAGKATTHKYVIEGHDWAEFRTTSAPLGSIYILNRSGPESDFQIDRLSGHRGLIRLIFAMQDDTPFPLPDVVSQQRDAALMLRLMQNIRACRFTYPSDYQRIDEAAAVLFEDSRRERVRVSD